MVRTRKAIYVGNQEVQRRYIGNKLIFENLGDMDDKVKVSGIEIFTDKADNSVVHVEIDGKSYQHTGSGKNLNSPEWAKDSDQEASFSGWDYRFDTYNEVKAGEVFTATVWINPLVKPARTMLEFGEEGKSFSRQILGNIIEVGESGYTTVTATALTDGWVRQVIRNTTAGTTVNRVFYKEAQLEKGSQRTPYEPPYEIPAPSPDYPIEIHSVNDFDVVSSTEKLSEGQLEEYDYGTVYENIYKINLLLSEPLRSVGDVKDRLFRDSDGLWKIERNVGKTVFDGSEGWSYQSTDKTYFTSAQNATITSSRIVSSHYVENTTTNEIGQIRFNAVRVNVVLNHDKGVMGVTGYKNWLSNNPVTILYTITPTIETLDQELQDKLNNLRSFEDSNYVYTISNPDISPTLHATFKSKGWYDDYQDTLLK